jgi:hypothetical protein
LSSELQKSGGGCERKAIQNADGREIGVAFGSKLLLVTDEHLYQTPAEKTSASDDCYNFGSGCV